MLLEFTKMEGCGNDYVYIDGMKMDVPQDKKPSLVQKLSDRHFGIGGDGVIFINKGNAAEYEMEMYNADGTRAEMCGNGIRCVGKFLYDRGYTDKRKIFTVESAGQIKTLTMTVDNEKAVAVRVDMGEPVLKAVDVPVVCENEQAVDEGIEVDGNTYKMTCVSMGNPHAVLFWDGNIKADDFKIEEIGPKFENHKRFPNRTNTEFVNVIDRTFAQMRVWERGTGETLACGTGTCATLVAAVLNGLMDDKADIELLGGTLTIEWDRANTNHVFMTGPATEVFTGAVEVDL